MEEKPDLSNCVRLLKGRHVTVHVIIYSKQFLFRGSSRICEIQTKLNAHRPAVSVASESDHATEMQQIWHEKSISVVFLVV